MAVAVLALLFALAEVASLSSASQSPRAADCMEWHECRQLALSAAERGEYETFHDLAWRAVQTGPPKDPALMYLLARAQTLSGRPHDALIMLLRLAELGVASPEAATSEEFSRTRQLPGWPEAEARILGGINRDAPTSLTAAIRCARRPRGCSHRAAATHRLPHRHGRASSFAARPADRRLFGVCRRHSAGAGGGPLLNPAVSSERPGLRFALGPVRRRRSTWTQADRRGRALEQKDRSRSGRLRWISRDRGRRDRRQTRRPVGGKRRGRARRGNAAQAATGLWQAPAIIPGRSCSRTRTDSWTWPSVPPEPFSSSTR